MTTTHNGSPDIATYIKARYPVIVLETFEERRAERLVLETAAAVGRRAYFWSVTRGLWTWRKSAREVVEAMGQAPPEAFLPKILEWASPPSDGDQAAGAQAGAGELASGIYTVFDYHPYVQSPFVQRIIRDLVATLPLRLGGATVIFCSPSFPIPPDLAHEVTVLDLPLPSADQLREVYDKQLRSANKSLAKTGKPELSPATVDTEAVVQGLRGLTTFEAENVLARSYTELLRFDPAIVTKEKESIVRRSGVLSVSTKVEPIENVGGLENVKSWLYQRRNAFSEEARRFGLPAPRGMLLVGPPGTGKSLIAKATASVWGGLPLLTCSISNLLGSHVGDSESRFRQAWATAEAVAPCVFLIDEADKAFMGHEGGQDSGVMSHIVGDLLTRMQERGEDDPMVFVLATANRYDVLPEPMLRKGRFDELWWVDLPNRTEREAIIRIHLRKRNRSMPDDVVKRFSAATAGFIGSEIEQVVIDALHAAFDARARPLEPDDLLEAAAKTVPLSKTKGDSIRAEREQALGKLRPASPLEVREEGQEQERVVEVG